jgi:hypothetical protein
MYWDELHELVHMYLQTAKGLRGNLGAGTKGQGSQTPAQIALSGTCFWLLARGRIWEASSGKA